MQGLTPLGTQAASPQAASPQAASPQAASPQAASPQRSGQETSARKPAPSSVPWSSAAEAGAQARSLVAEARRSGAGAAIDQPLWKQAAEAAEAAVRLAPGTPEYLDLRAGIYTETGFWSRALSSWQAYFAQAGNQATAQARTAAAQVHAQLAYAAYGRGDLTAASSLLSSCLDVAPDDVGCTLWAGRLALEAGDFARAQALYARAAQLNPADKVAPYFSRVAAQASEYGAGAARAFSQAYADLEAGRQAEALRGFQDAARLAPAFAEAQREVGRLSLERGNVTEARAAYTALTALPGATDADRYNLTLTTEAESYGLAAAREFRRGYGLYTSGDRAGAEAAFGSAASQSPQYAKAWAWLGRVQYEGGRFAEAAASYGRAVDLNPADGAAAHFLRLSRAQLK